MLSGKLRHSQSHRAKALANRPICLMRGGLTYEDIHALIKSSPGSVVQMASQPTIDFISSKSLADGLSFFRRKTENHRYSDNSLLRKLRRKA